MKFVITVISILVITVAHSSAEHRNSTGSVLNDEPEKHSRFESSTCPHKDYRSYVKCLQNHRRREVQSQPQATSRGSTHGGTNCMDECERESCRHQSTGPCAEVCYDRCLKKTKEIHHRITEYETTCGEGEDCDNAGESSLVQGPPAIANLTTSIDIRNYVNNTNVILHTNPKTDEGDRDRGDRRDHDHNRGRNNTCRPGQPGCEETGIEDRPRVPQPGFQPWYPSPSLTLIPQIQMIPQVTFSLGIGPGVGFGSLGGGCAYASIWLCLSQQQQQQQQQQQVRECSGCSQPYPYSRGKCDPLC